MVVSPRQKILNEYLAALQHCEHRLGRKLSCYTCCWSTGNLACAQLLPAQPTHRLYWKGEKDPERRLEWSLPASQTTSGSCWSTSGSSAAMSKPVKSRWLEGQVIPGHASFSSVQPGHCPVWLWSRESRAAADSAKGMGGPKAS